MNRTTIGNPLVALACVAWLAFGLPSRRHSLPTKAGGPLSGILVLLKNSNFIIVNEDDNNSDERQEALHPDGRGMYVYLWKEETNSGLLFPWCRTATYTLHLMSTHSNGYRLNEDPKIRTLFADWLARNGNARDAAITRVTPTTRYRIDPRNFALELSTLAAAVLLPLSLLNSRAWLLAHRARRAVRLRARGICPFCKYQSDDALICPECGAVQAPRV